MLLVASYVFYGFWDWRFLFLMLASTIIDFFCSIRIDNTENLKQRKFYLLLSIVANLSFLAIFKYFNFFIENFDYLLNTLGISFSPLFISIIVPVGISFYTFQTMSYTIDVYWKKLNPTRSFLDYALYVSFFPQLVAGPIERGTRLIPQILSPRVVDTKKFFTGSYLVFWGLFLKVFIADNLALLVDPVFSTQGPYHGGAVILALYSFSVQIYCDFAGYSFIAIGIALMLGIELMENFRRPYLARNISDFWRRWHISLSTWFRDYLYIPLGGNRLGKWRRALNLVIVFLLCGFWHGANWTFIVWGAYHGLAIGFYFLIRDTWDRMPMFVQIFLTFQVVCLGWLFFRAENMSQALQMLSSIFSGYDIQAQINLQETAIQLFAFSIILFVVQVFQDWKEDTFVILRLPMIARNLVLSGFAILIVLFGNFTDRPFIYFQF